MVSTPGNLTNGKTARRPRSRCDLLRHALAGEALRPPCSARRSWPPAGRWPWTRGTVRGHADSLRSRRLRRPWIELHVHQTTTLSALAISSVWRRSSSWMAWSANTAAASRPSRPNAPRLLDVLHDAADDDPPAIGQASTSLPPHRSGKRSSSTRRIVRHLHRLAHVALEVALVDDSIARPQHVGWANDQRVTDFVRETQRLVLGRCRCPVGRLLEAEAPEAVSGNARGLQRRRSCPALVPMIGTPVGFEVTRQFERRLAAVLDDDANRLLDVRDFSTSSSVSGSKYRRSEVS